MNGLHILGTGRALPANIVTNDDLALRVETSDEWIVSRTGIRERRWPRRPPAPPWNGRASPPRSWGCA